MKIIKLYLSSCLLLSLLSSCAIGWDMWRDPIRVANVVNGNTLKLENGVSVELLGLENTQNSQQRLQQFLVPEDGDGPKIRFIRDNSFPFRFPIDEEFTIYAYAITDDDKNCINSMILKEGLSMLSENPYLQDSLEQFRNYALNSNAQKLVQNPVIKPVLDENIQDTIRKYANGANYDEGRIHHDRWSSDGNQNCDMLEKACDYTNSITKGFANLLATKNDAEGDFNVKQICNIYSYLREKWKYVNDPADEEFLAYASESISRCNLTGDCDDFSVLMASCILAVKGTACINIASKDHGAHAFTEVDVSNFSQDEVDRTVKEYFGERFDVDIPLLYRHDGEHVWLILDWFSSYPGGKYWKDQDYDSWNTYIRENREWKWKELK